MLVQVCTDLESPLDITTQEMCNSLARKLGMIQEKITM